MRLKIFIFIIYSTINLFAQGYAIRAVSEANNDSEFTINVQIKMEKSEESKLGNATMRFSYDTHELHFPDLPSEGIDFVFNLNSTGQYLCSVTKPEPGKISVNIYFREGTPQLITNKYHNIVSIKFNKKIGSGNLELNTYSAEIFSPNKQKPWQLKDFSLGFRKNITAESMQ